MPNQMIQNPNVWHLCCKALVLLQERCLCVLPYFDILNHSWTRGNAFVPALLQLEPNFYGRHACQCLSLWCLQSMVKPEEYRTPCSQKHDIQTCIAIKSSVFTYSILSTCAHTQILCLFICAYKMAKHDLRRHTSRAPLRIHELNSIELEQQIVGQKGAKNLLGTQILCSAGIKA